MCLGACDIFYTQSDKTIETSGKVSFESSALSGVKIKTKTQVLCQTDENGNYNFSINANEVEIFAEKQGYAFTPRSIIITDSTTDLNFVAEKVEDLNGELALSKIIITPTSIGTLPDNFKYTDNGQEYLKISSISLKIVNNQYLPFVEDGAKAIKNQKNTFVLTEQYSVKTSQKFAINFSISAHFRSYGDEYNFTESRTTTLNVSANQTTAMLNDNKEFVVSLIGVNSSNNMFSYDISFVFDYYPTI